MKKLNTKLKSRTARYPQPDGLDGRVNETMHILLRCYIIQFEVDWVSYLPMVEL